jgi:hypothetical protein
VESRTLHSNQLANEEYEQYEPKAKFVLEKILYKQNKKAGFPAF